MLSIGKIASGTGWEYLAKDLRYAQGEYYIGEGQAPTEWLGRGAAGLELDGQVSEDQMLKLFGMGVDWRTGEPLGRRWRVSTLSDDPAEREGQLVERVAGRVQASEERLGRPLVAEERAAIEQQVRGRAEAKTVAGLDLTFSPPKSVSLLFAGLDAPGRDQVRAALDVATRATIEHLESEAGTTRAGHNGVRRLDTDGWTVASFEHHTSRAGDIQLHRHLAVLNKVRTRDDGGWRAVDGTAVYRTAAAAGAIGQRVLESELSRRLGVEWTPQHEIVGIPEAAIRQQSKRRAAIVERMDDLSDNWRGRDSYAGRSSASEMADRVTLSTRPVKQDAPLGEVLDRVRAELRDTIDVDLVAVAGRVTDAGRIAPPAVGPQHVERLAKEAVDLAQSRRAAWSHADLTRAAAEVIDVDLLPGDPGALRDAVERITAHALGGVDVVRVNAPAVHATHPSLRTSDGRSVYDHGRSQDRFTTQWMLDAERRILDAARRFDAPTLDADVVELRIRGHLADRRSAAQADAVRSITLGGRRLVAVEGPAGTGKSRMMRETAALWKASGREVLGLALSQNAANVLAGEAGIRCENLAKYIYELDAIDRRDAQGQPPRAGDALWRLPAGALVIIDEAAMAATHQIDRVLHQVEAAGGVLVLVGDPAQISAVEAGGALALVAGDVGACRLDTVRRQSAEWEREATLRLRDGDATVLEAYFTRHRITAGTLDESMDACYRYWLADRVRGVDVLMVTDTNADAADLAGRARAQLVDWGVVETDGVRLHDGNRAGVGDEIVSRLNARAMTDSGGRFVANRDVWTVRERHDDGSLVVERKGGTGELVTMSAAYVAESVELAYAGTVAAAQGRTVDACHTVASERTTREAFYVAMTRGREDNTAHVVATLDPEHAPIEQREVEAVLAGVLERSDAAVAATEAIRQSAREAHSLATLYPRWSDATTEAVAVAAHHAVVRRHGLRAAGAVLEDSAVGAFQRELWRASALGHDVDAMLDSVLDRGLIGVESPAAVLAWRVEHTQRALPNPVDTWTQRTVRNHTPQSWTAQQIAAAMDARVEQLRADMRQLVDAGELPDWADRLLIHDQHTDVDALVDALARAAAYRETWGIDPQTPLIGHEPGSSDPVRLSAHATVQRAVEPHLAVSRATTEALQQLVRSADRFLANAPEDQRPHLAPAHRELRSARLAGDADRVTAALAAVDRIEAAASTRQQWWDQTQTAIVRGDLARQELRRRGADQQPTRQRTRGVTR